MANKLTKRQRMNVLNGLFQNTEGMYAGMQKLNAALAFQIAKTDVVIGLLKQHVPAISELDITEMAKKSLEESIRKASEINNKEDKKEAD